MAIASYILEGRKGFLRREDPFLTCDEEVHAVVYDPERAEQVCSKCGLVLDEEKLDFLTEPNAVPRGRAPRRRKGTSRVGSLKRNSLERSLRETFLEKSIRKAVQDKALELCRLVRKRQFQTAYPVPTLSNALVYAAHRLCRVPLTLTECAGTSPKERKRVARCYERLCRKLELKVPRLETTDYLSHLAEKKRIRGDTVTLAGRILKKVKEKRLAGGANPVGISAAALYVACSLTGNAFTQKELASAAGVSEVTLRANCKTLVNLLQTLPHHEQRV